MGREPPATRAVAINKGVILLCKYLVILDQTNTVNMVEQKYDTKGTEANSGAMGESGVGLQPKDYSR